MKNLKLPFVLFCISFLTIFTFAQSDSVNRVKVIKATPAFQVLESHKFAVESDLTNLRKIDTEIHPDVYRKKFELELTELEIVKVLTVPESKKILLTETYGKLLVQKITATMELHDFLRTHTVNHPQLPSITDKIRRIEYELYEGLN